MNSTQENELNQQKEKTIEIDEKEAKQRLASQLTKFLGGRDKVKVFAQECKAVGLDLNDINNVIGISKNIEWFTILLNYSELGLLSKLGKAITKIKEN